MELKTSRRFESITSNKYSAEAVVAQGHKGVSVTLRLWVRSPLEEIKYVFKFIFRFLRSGVEARSGVEFRHSARNAFKNSVENLEQSVLTLGSLCMPCCVWDIA